MAVVGRLRTSISLDSAQFQQSMQGINRQLRGLKAETRAVTSSGTGFARGVDEMNRKADVLNRTLKVQQAQVKELRERYEQSRRATGENSKETQNANIQYQRAVAEMNKTENALKGLTAEIERQTNPWNKLSENLDHAGQKIQDFGRGMSSFGRTMSTRVTAPILGVGAGILKVGMDFEAGMSQVQALTQGTAEEMKAMSDLAKELGESTRFSASEAAEGMAFLGMAGFETSQIIAAMPGLLDLAASANMNLGRAADIASNIISGFGYTAEETGRVADVLAKGASNANTNVEQLGDAMATVAPVAAALGLDVEGLTAAVGFMSDAGIQGSQAGRMLRQGLLRLSSPTGEAADLIEKLGINVFDADGNIKELHDVVNELSDGLDGMSSQAQTAALATIFGSESVAGWTSLIERGGKELSEFTSELKDSEGAASEMASIMQSNAKGAMTEFRSAVEGVGIALSEHMIPVVTDFIHKGTELVRKFGELDKETQQNIIKMGLFAAAIGPVAMVAGSLTTAIGGVVRVSGSLVSLLGGTGGLLARLGLMGAATGPVGLAIGAVGLLAGGIYALNVATRENITDTLKSIEAKEKELDATDELIDSFEELRKKNQLSTDEMLRYMDIMTELENAETEETIKRLTKEQEALLEKSGFTNEEMEEFLRLNQEIVEKSPETVKAISEQGNAYAENLQELKELQKAERERLTSETYLALTAELDNQTRNLEKQAKLQEEISEKEEERTQKLNEINNATARIMEIDQEILDVQKELSNASADQVMGLEEKLRLLNFEKLDMIDIVKSNEKAIDKIDKQIGKKQKSLEKTNEELSAFDELTDKYEQMVLFEAGINAEKGKGLDALDAEIIRIKRARSELKENTDTVGRNSKAYKETVKELDNQLNRLNQARDKLIGINNLASETIYEKRVNIVTDPTISSLNSMLSAPINKRIELQGYQFRAMAYAEGTNFHPGGPFIAGEEGWELGRLGDQWEILNLGMYDRPRGYQVFTHEESKKIMRSLNNIPKYANGTNMSQETNRIVNRMSETQSNQPIVLEIHVTSEIDGRVAGQAVEKYVTEIQQRNQEVKEAFA